MMAAVIEAPSACGFTPCLQESQGSPRQGLEGLLPHSAWLLASPRPWPCAHWPPLSRGHVPTCRQGGCDLGTVSSPISAKPRSPEQGRQCRRGSVGILPKPVVCSR